MEEQEEPLDKGGRSLWDWLPTALAFFFIYAVLWLFFGRWPFGDNLLFSLTTTAGGDMGAHHYPAQYLIQELLPNFRLTGWAPGWYAGMPMLTFYFPFPFLLIAILDWFIPYQIAFKLITVLGVFALPLTAYAMGRLWRVRKPFAIMAAAFALVFLLMEHTAGGQLYSIYGGNILSTLAGEFGYMLSFALVFLFLGTVYRGMEKPRFNMLFVLNCLILMALVLSHIVTTIVLVCIVPGLLLVHWRWRSLGYLVAVGLGGLCLTAFWWLPFVSNLEWTAHMAWGQLGWSYLAPSALWPVAVLGFIGMAYAVARRERRMLPLLWMTVVSLALFKLLPTGRLWNARLLPFWYISWHLWAAFGAAWLVRPFTVMMWDLFRAPSRIGRRIHIPVTVLVVVAAAGLLSTTAAGWINWNYSGYESREGWTQYQEIIDYIDTLSPPGRVLAEHDSSLIDRLGTSRAFELIPYWTRQDTMEGTLMEASYTAAFHFINQAELSEQPSNAIIGVKYPGLDIHRGITHLQFMNIPYFLASYNDDADEKVMPGLLADPRADLLATFGDYNIFRISGCSGYVQVMENQPVRLDVKQKEWRDLAVEWYKNEDALDTALVWDNGEEALQEFASITPEQSESPPEVPIETEGYVTNELLSNESLEFDTTAIGKPHWIKISYFPNWHVEGADGPYLVSPSFMMVIPRQSHVVLTYGRTAANTVGQVLEVLAWALLLGLTAWRFVRWLRRRRLAEAVLESPPIFGGEPPTSGGLGAGMGAGTAEQGRDMGLEGADSGYYVDAGSDYRDAVDGTEPGGDASIDRDERPGV